MSTPSALLYTIELAETLHEVRELSGREALNEPFLFEIRFGLMDGAVDPDALIRSVAKLRMRRSEVVRTITGVVTDVQISAVISGAPEVAVTLEPQLAIARYRQDIRLFRHKTGPQIISEVLNGLGIAHQSRLTGSYPSRAYTVQHHETDFHFANRLMEEEGIYFFFNQHDTMILGDTPGGYDVIGAGPAIPFLGASALDQNDDAVWAVGQQSQMSVSKVTLRDWNPEAPSLKMDVTATGPTAGGPEFYDYPGEYLLPAEGQRNASRIADAFDCVSRGISGKTYCAPFLPGCRFTLTGPPGGVAAGEYVITTVTHKWHRTEGGFSLDFEALPADTTCRPLNRHPEPILPNPVTGIVTGPAGEDIYTDELGRVKVHFHWDRLFPYDGECSHWVPVLQDNTGHSVAMPRIGWEVLVHFLEGDPDRPVVLGRVYNAEDTFPNMLPRDKTRTALRSLSSPTRDGFNQIEFEDLSSEEYIYTHAERDQNIVIANNREETTLVNQNLVVKHDETIEVGNNVTVDVTAHQSTLVTSNLTESIKGNRRVAIGQEEQNDISANRTVNIGSQHFRRIGRHDTTAAKKLNEVVGGAIVEASAAANEVSSEKVMALTVGGAIVEIAAEGKTETATKRRVETIGGLVYAQAKQDIKIRTDKIRTTTVGTMLNINAVEETTFTGREKLSMQSREASQTADTVITMKVGDTIVIMRDELIKIVTKDAIEFKISGDNVQAADESFQI